MRILSIVGARPQFIKIAPLCREIEKYNKSSLENVEHIIVHTGQHYDKGMSSNFFKELEIPRPEINLGIGSGKQGVQTARMLEKIEEVLLEIKPDVVIIYGDTNSTVAGALAPVKLHIPTAHVEAGLRSFNRKMPEEINRIVADHVSDILFAPTKTAMDNLKKEGLASRSIFTGDIMYDAILSNRILAEKKSKILEKLSLNSDNFALATIHRAENTDNIERLHNILDAFNEISETHYPVIFPVHPRTQKYIKEKLSEWQAHPNFQLINPVGYLDIIHLVNQANLVLTDSGGLQKEAFFLNKPCITLRDETEWIETVKAQANLVVGTEPEKILKAVSQWELRIKSNTKPSQSDITDSFGKGDAAKNILSYLIASRGTKFY